MSFLAEQSGVGAFKAIPLDTFSVDADATVVDGVAHLKEATISAAAAEFIVNGQVVLVGSLDLTVEAFVGPSVAGALKRVGIELAAVQQIQRMASIPIAIRVSGRFDALSSAPTSPRTVERTGRVVGTGNEQVQKGGKGLVDWLRRK